MTQDSNLPRRDFVKIAAGITISAGLGLRPHSLAAAVRGPSTSAPRAVEYDLVVDRQGVRFGDRSAQAPTINNMINHE